MGEHPSKWVGGGEDTHPDKYDLGVLHPYLKGGGASVQHVGIFVNVTCYGRLTKCTFGVRVKSTQTNIFVCVAHSVRALGLQMKVAA